MSFSLGVFVDTGGRIDFHAFGIFLEEGFISRDDGGVDEPGAVVEKEGFLFVLADEIERVFVVLMEGETVFIDAILIVFSSSGEALGLVVDASLTMCPAG